jgi:hypothetical protein
MIANDIETAKAMKATAKAIRALERSLMVESIQPLQKTQPRPSWARSRAFICGAATALKVIKLVELAKYEMLLRKIRRAICQD